MSYFRKSRPGLGDVTTTRSCSMVTGQCTDGKMVDGTPIPQAKPESSGPSASDVVGAFFKGLTGSIGTSTMTPAQAPVVVQAPSSGISTTTALAIGGAALLAVLLLRD